MAPFMYSHRQMVILEQGPYCIVMTNGVKAAVGEKENDSYFMAYEVVGRHTIRMPLLDLVSVGADLEAVSVTTVNEQRPAAEAMIRGMGQELSAYEIPFLVSSEDHFNASVTGLGVTLLGRAPKDRLLLGRVERGHKIWLHGAPVAGMDVADNAHRLPTAQWLSHMARQKGVRELLPCSMKGIAGALDKMSSSYGLSYELEPQAGIDFKKSCGPYGGILVVADGTFVGEDVIEIGAVR